MMRIGAIWILALLGIVALASGASASPVTYTGYSVLNNQTVTISDPTLNVSERGGSGEITLSGTNTANGSLFTWCVDIAHNLQSSGQFPTQYFLTGTFGSEVNALLSNGLALLSSNTDASSALQVAIWQEEYGSALTVTAPTAVATLASTLMGNVASGAWRPDLGKAVLVFDGNGANQSQATLVPVPEPATLAIVGVGLAGIALRRLRRPVRAERSKLR